MNVGGVRHSGGAFAVHAGFVNVRQNFLLRPRGRFYLPSTSVEAMYDATKNARTKGQWVEVFPAGR